MLASGNSAGGGNLTDGIAGFDYGDVNPSFEITVRAPVLATYDPYADIKARTTRAMTLTWGTAQFNRIKLVSGTNLCLHDLRHADRLPPVVANRDGGEAGFVLSDQVRESPGVPAANAPPVADHHLDVHAGPRGTRAGRGGGAGGGGGVTAATYVAVVRAIRSANACS